MDRARTSLLVLIGLATCALWIQGLPGHDAAATFAWRSALLFGLQLGAVAIAWRARDDATIWLVLAFAFCFRVAAWTWPPDLSSDLYRYVWDARVQAAGVSPYLFPPAASELAALRDTAIWPYINRPGALTVYPPGAEAAFRALVPLGLDSVWGVKTAAVAAELAALALLVRWIRRREGSAGALALYAWSPLVVAEVCVSAHVEVLVLPLALAAFWTAERRRAIAAGALIGAAALVKLWPLLLLAALPRAGRTRAVPAAAAVLAAGYAVYGAGAGPRVLGFLPEFVRTGEDFNLGLRGFVQEALAPWPGAARPIAIALCGAGLLAVLAHLARGAGDPGETAPRAQRAVAWWVLLMPTAVHPWYALLLAPLTALAPTPAACWLIGTLPLSYLKYGAPGGEMPAWVRPLEWLPAWGLTAAAAIGWPRLRAARLAVAGGKP